MTGRCAKRRPVGEVDDAEGFACFKSFDLKCCCPLLDLFTPHTAGTIDNQRNLALDCWLGRAGRGHSGQQRSNHRRFASG
jgi:hypothetical protein